MELWNRLMMKRYLLFGNECWKMSRLIDYADVSLLEVLEWHVDRVVGISDIAAFRDQFGIMVSRGHMGAASVTIEFVNLFSLAHHSSHLFTGSCEFASIRVHLRRLLAASVLYKVHTDIKFLLIIIFGSLWEILLVLMMAFSIYSGQVFITFIYSLVQ